MLKEILNKVKRTDGEKVSFTVKLPIVLKKDFEKLCKKNQVPMTSVLVELIEQVIQEDRNDDVNESINDLQSIIISSNQMIESGLDESDVGFNPIEVRDAAKGKLKRMSC